MFWKNVLDLKLGKFILVGLGNTGLSAACMFLLYNLTSLGYWGASAIAYTAGGIFSFFMNKNFTFRSKGPVFAAAARFIAIILACYIIAYSLAKPFIFCLLNGCAFSNSAVEQFALLFGLGTFTMLNYIGQRFFVFAQRP